jgi:hypothetical protein
MKITRSIIILCLVFSITGCDAFIRKFTRKPKKDQTYEPPVLAPEEYKGPQTSKEEQYRQFFIFWRSWQDELIQSLQFSKNYKKHLDCANESLKNLVSMRSYLKEIKQKQLDAFIIKMNDLKSTVSSDTHGRNVAWSRQKAEKIRRDVIRDFSFPKIKPFLLS